RPACARDRPVGAAPPRLRAASYPEEVERKRPPSHAAGAVLLAAGLLALLGGLGKGGLSLPLLVLGAALLIALAFVERRAAEPVVPPDLFRDPTITYGCAANTLFGVVLFAY